MQSPQNSISHLLYFLQLYGKK